MTFVYPLGLLRVLSSTLLALFPKTPWRLLVSFYDTDLSSLDSENVKVLVTLKRLIYILGSVGDVPANSLFEPFL